MTTLFSSFDPLARRLTRREIMIEYFRGLGQPARLAQVDAGHGSILVDAYLTPEAIFYGVRFDVDDVEPVAYPPSNRTAAP